MKKALIIVDMINDFVTGKLGSPRAREIVPNIAALIKKAREQRIPIVYLRDAHSSNDNELAIWGEHAMKGTQGSEIIPGLKPEKKDIIIEKKWYSGFVDTGLPQTLKKIGADTLIFTGVSTDICVQNNVGHAYFSGYKTIVPRDCTASIDEESHEQALKYMKNIYGTEITTSDKVL
ncbi:MAG: cysteine hydrolase [Euryarchaeota archaeon]|nr:cysteine hydrolase [Euryarchaeota archaeon]MBU4492726.1 cysteine hydrolase [Euryarchaeota archaeon]MCG2728218.1 cysteine hydrolase [Candidatus Methanoperedenaceae archaeon]